VATHVSDRHKITVALAIDASPCRIKLKFVDARANATASKSMGGIPDHVYREQLENGRHAPKIGLILLESSNNSRLMSGLRVVHDQFSLFLL
jgi:hypothetical protein